MNFKEVMSSNKHKLTSLYFTKDKVFALFNTKLDKKFPNKIHVFDKNCMRLEIRLIPNDVEPLSELKRLLEKNNYFKS